MKLDVIYNEDCLIGLSRIPDKSIDMILSDLPYGITACQWDSLLPLERLWGQFERITKENAVIALSACQPFTSTLVASNPKLFRYEWIWEKPQGTNPLQAKHQPMRVHESILIFAKKKPRYFPQMTAGKPYKGFASEKGKTIGEVFGAIPSVHNENHGTRYPRSIQRFAQERQGFHPTQKPVALCEYLIKTYTEEGEVVLDSCCGSGSILVAAANTNRRYIGFEIERKYFDIAKGRLNGLPKAA